MRAQATIVFIVAAIFSIGAVFTVLWVAPWLESKWRPADVVSVSPEEPQ